MGKKEVILRALEAKGVIVESIEYKPIGTALQMCGNSGGWEVYVHEAKSFGLDNPLVGYNYQEILNQINKIQ